MDVYLIDQPGPERRDPEELPTLLAEGDGIVWVDIPQCSLHEAQLLERVFGFSEIALHDCVIRNHVSKIQSYDDHIFTVLHAPQIGVMATSTTSSWTSFSTRTTW